MKTGKGTVYLTGEGFLKRTAKWLGVFGFSAAGMRMSSAGLPWAEEVEGAAGFEPGDLGNEG